MITVGDVRVRSLARYLDKEIFPGPRPPTTEERRSLRVMGGMTLVAWLIAVLFVALFFYNIGSVLITLGFLVELFPAGQQEQTAFLAFCRSLQQGIPFVVILLAFVRAVETVRQSLEDLRQRLEDLRRNLQRTDSEDLVIVPVLDQSLRARVLRVIDYLPRAGVRLLLEAQHPEAYVKPSPYVLTAAAILALVAEKKGIEPELVFAELAGRVAEPREPLAVRESLRLLGVCEMISEKASLTPQGREVRRLVLTERGQLTVQRFDLASPPPRPDIQTR